MEDNNILIPGQTGAEDCAQPTVQSTEDYLKKSNYLSEFDSDEQKSIVRENLNIYPKTQVYTQQEADIKAKGFVQEAMQQHLQADDPHGTLAQVDNKIADMVKTDGSTPFTNPQTGVDPLSDYHLTTKRFVQQLLNSHIATNDPHSIIPKVEQILNNYVKLSQVYFKDQVYTQQQTDYKLTKYIKSDGTTPFTKGQIGVDPTIDSHLSTKRYVDQVMWDHLSDIDPHGFLATLNQRLAGYYKKTETYSKAELYSRVQIDGIIRTLVNQAAVEAIQEHVNQYDPHHTLQEVEKLYVQQDGSTAFTAPQKGVEGVVDNDLVTLSQLKALEEKLQNNIDTKESVWITAGPVQTTVGYVEDNQVLSDTMTLQEIMDAIFYGKSVEVKTESPVLVGNTTKVDMYVRGSLGLIQFVELYQNGKLVNVFYKGAFEEDKGHAQTDSLPITEDTTFKIIVHYTNGTTLTATCDVEVSLGVFVGLLPKWYSGNLITWDYLQDLIQEDSYNNKLYGSISESTSSQTISQKFKFTSYDDPKHIFVVIPENYSQLISMSTLSQQFGLDAFDIISQIPLDSAGDGESIIYTVYIYRQAIVTANDLQVTFNFNKE